ncbi:type II toxin-antitoxin system prevent-host-death family antitoxin [Streptomyces sclerotialus]|uniref:type II toxin-antitoxin system prevent-host-death family antitoxin n=1 Tax=Streptomyces sclerotialus TaxID=1957 RepID=UPI0004C7ABCE
MSSVEMAEAVADFAALVRRVHDTGRRLTLTAGGEPAAVLLPAAELTELDEQAAAGHGAPVADRLPKTDDEAVMRAPMKAGPFLRHAHTDGEGITFTQDDGVAVAVLLPAAEFDRLQDLARIGRQGRMSPQQSAAFAEFLARQSPPPDA